MAGWYFISNRLRVAVDQLSLVQFFLEPDSDIIQFSNHIKYLDNATGLQTGRGQAKYTSMLLILK